MNQERETAKIITSALDRAAAALDEATLDRLAAARNKALLEMPAPAVETVQALAGFGRFAEFGRFFDLHGQRLWTPVLGLLGAALIVFILAQTTGSREPLEADALLLASDLPPEAYLDKGFDAWLEQSSRR